MKVLASGAVVMSAATFGCDMYLSASNSLERGAQRVTLCDALQAIERDRVLGDLGQTDERRFIYISPDDGVVYNVEIRNHKGCCYFLANYRRKGHTRDGFFWTRKHEYTAIVDVLDPKSTKIGAKCPANTRTGNKCKPI